MRSRSLLAKLIIAGSASLCLCVIKLRRKLLPISPGRLAFTVAVSPSVKDPFSCSNVLPINSHHLVQGGFRGDQFKLKRNLSRFVSSLLLYCALMLGLSSMAQAGEFCSDFPIGNTDPSGGIIDGDDYVTAQLYIQSTPRRITRLCRWVVTEHRIA